MHYGPHDRDTHIGRPPGGDPRPVRRKRPSAMIIAGVVAALIIIGLSVTLAVVLTKQSASPTPSASPAQAAVAATPSMRSMLGTMTMPRYSSPRTAYDTPNWKATATGGCEGVGGYSDMGVGATVTVYDGSDKIIGVGGLVFGVRHGQDCEWSFGINDLPDVAFYQVEVGHRGKVSVQRADLGNVALTLGD